MTDERDRRIARYIVWSLILLIGLLVMPNGPWYRDLIGAMIVFYAGWQAARWDL